MTVAFDEAYMMSAREKFFEIVDGLKKEKIIKSTLELVIQTKSEKVCSLEKVDAEDWFTVSKVMQHDEEGELGVFEVEGETFKILKAAKCKCPRCWKYRSKTEEDLCHRCNEALNA
jgi:isoleucyl-tRNA synthetase